jgi:hypothetical protein
MSDVERLLLITDKGTTSFFAEKFVKYIISHAPPIFPYEKSENQNFSRAAYAAI